MFKKNFKRLRELKAYKELIKLGYEETNESLEDDGLTIELSHPNTDDIIIEIKYQGEL